MKNKLLFIYNIPSPYRVEFINELAKYIDFKLFFEKDNAKHRNNNWLANDNLKKENVLYINRNILNFIKLLYHIHKSEIVILGGYSTKISIFLIIFLKVIKKDFILNADGGFIKKESKLKYKIKNFLIKSAKYWLSTGIETNKYLKYYGAKEENIFIYPFTSVNKNEILLQKKLKKKKRRKVLFVGSFKKEKGIDKLVKTATLSPNLDFVFVGGKPSSRLVYLSEKKENILFIDHVNKQELKNYYIEADLFVFPTYSDVWGLVINEAMAQGLPIITTDKCIAGIEMIKSDDIGKIIPVNTSAEKLAEYIDYAAYNYENFNTNKIINIAHEYTIEKMAEAHIKIIDKVLENQ